MYSKSPRCVVGAAVTTFVGLTIVASSLIYYFTSLTIGPIKDPVPLWLTHGTYGVIQVNYEEVTGVVCQTYFEDNNLGCTVACRQLGFTYGNMIYCGGEIDKELGPALMNKVIVLFFRIS